MARLAQREQFRLLQVELKKDSGVYEDFSQFLGEEPVIVEEVAFGIDSLKFTLVRNAEFLLETVARGMRVRFKGGYLFGRQEWLFDGYVGNWDPVFPDSGQVKMEVTCYSVLWLLTRYKPGCIQYPTIPYPFTISNRTFQIGTSISLSAVVKGILAEYGSELKLGGVSIPKDRDFLFTLYNPVVQNEDETDFAFLTRLLRGKTGPHHSHYHTWVEEARRHGQAVFFTETRGTGKAPETALHVIPEVDLLDETNRSDVEFVFHRQGADSPIVDPETYSPDALDARIPIHGVTVDENQDEAEGYEQLIIKEAPKKKDRKGKGDVPVPNLEVGKPAEVDQTPEEDADESPPEGWFAWEADIDAIRESRQRGELAGLPKNDFELIAEIKRSWPWSRAKKYFRPRQVVFESSSKQIGEEHDEAVIDETPTKPVDPSKKKKKQAIRKGKNYEFKEPRAMHWGILVKFSTFHGSPVAVGRKVYALRGLLARYSGDYVMIKIVHEFGTKYVNHVELAR